MIRNFPDVVSWGHVARLSHQFASPFSGFQIGGYGRTQSDGDFWEDFLNPPPQGRAWSDF